jgi:hypothetical protein
MTHGLNQLIWLLLLNKRTVLHNTSIEQTNLTDEKIYLDNFVCFGFISESDRGLF